MSDTVLTFTFPVVSSGGFCQVWVILFQERCEPATEVPSGYLENMAQEETMEEVVNSERDVQLEEEKSKQSYDKKKIKKKIW